MTHQSYEPIEGEGGSGVVGAVVEGWDLLVFPRLVAFLKELPPSWVQGTDWLQQNKARVNGSDSQTFCLNVTTFGKSIKTGCRKVAVLQTIYKLYFPN